MNVEGVILAAGLSSRAGGFKPSLELGGKTMIARCLEGMEEVCDRIIVVGGHEFERLCALVEGSPKVDCIENPHYQRGMFTSVKAGLGRVGADRCFVLPVDVPLVPRVVYERLLSVQADVVIPSFHGKSGHPVCLSSRVIPSILARPDESSLRDALHEMGFQIIEVEAAEILMDIDTPEDYRRARLSEFPRSVPPHSTP